MADRVGQQVGNYRLVRLLGQSDWAAVYVGEHLSLHTQVAIKVFTLPLTGADVGRFSTEGNVLARLAHSSLLRVLEGGLEGDRPFLVMDYASGGSVRARHPRGTVLQAPVMFSYLKPMVAALRYLQEHYLIHGNLKPENMLLGRSDALVLSDVSLPVLAQKRRSLMHQQEASSINYVAPEQLLGQPSPASDQYALGIVVYEWLSGDVPFHGSLQEIIQQHLSFSPLPLRGKNPAVSSYVEDVVLKALAKNPGHRFASVQAFVEELEQACQATQSTGGGLPSSAPSLPSLTPAVKPSSSAQSATASGAIICTYRGHTHFVQVAVWSPDGTRIASASVDKTVQVWNAATGSHLFTYQGHADRVQAVAWSPDGTRIASAGDDGTVRIWDASTGRDILTYRSRAPIVYTITWSPDGKRIASNSALIVEVWDTSSGSLLLTYRSHASGVTAVAWSPSGKYLASAAIDQTVQVWDATVGNTLFTYRGHADEVLAVAWSPDEKYIASASADQTVHVWGGGAVGTICTYQDHTTRVLAVGWSPDGRRIASADNTGMVHVWDAATGATVFIYRGHGGKLMNRVNAIGWSPDGKHIASASDDGTVQVWQAP
jgi:serine/threonine protein kinase